MAYYLKKYPSPRGWGWTRVDLMKEGRFLSRGEDQAGGALISPSLVHWAIGRHDLAGNEPEQTHAEFLHSVAAIKAKHMPWTAAIFRMPHHLHALLRHPIEDYLSQKVAPTTAERAALRAAAPEIPWPLEYQKRMMALANPRQAAPVALVRWLRVQRQAGKTHAQLSLACGTARGNVSQWLARRLQPPIDLAVELCTPTRHSATQPHRNA